MGSEAESLVRRYYLYGGVYTLAASIIWGITALFLLDAGLSVTDIFVANAAFSVGTMLFEIPTGVVADTIGRRISFLLSLAVLAATTLAYVGLAEVGGGLLSFSVVSILMGLGFTFYSGAMEAWLVDGVRHLGFDGDLDEIFARGQMITGAAMLVGTVGGGLLGQVDLAIPFLLRSALLALLFSLAYSGMKDLGFQPRRVSLRTIPAEAALVARTGVRFGWRHGSLRLLIAASAVQYGFFAWAWYAWQPYFLELLERDAVWVAGVVAAILALSMIVGNAIVVVVTRWCGRRTTLFLYSAGAFSAAMFGVGAASSFPLALALLAIAGVAIGVQMPVRQSFIHHIVPGEHRATVVSFDSMVAGGAGAIGQPSLGALAERRGFSSGYMVGALLTLAAVPLLALIRRGEDEADYFEGSVSHASRSCAPSGLPSLSQVDGDVVV